MTKSEKIEILKNIFRGQNNAFIPQECTHKDICDLIDMEIDGLGRPHFYKDRGPRPHALYALHRRLQSLRMEIERPYILAGKKNWHINRIIKDNSKSDDRRTPKAN